MFSVAEVALALRTEFKGTDFDFTNVVTDSREIKGGELFVALKGEKFDGHSFVNQAVSKGVRGVVLSADKDVPDDVAKFLVEDTLSAYQELAKAYRKRFKKVHVIAITGSNGKTSTKDMLSHCLGKKYSVVKTEKNFNNEIGLSKTLFQIHSDTEFAVVEIGMRGMGQIRALSKVARQETGLITNVGDAHLELLGSREKIAAAKTEILESLTSTGFAILNGDDKLVRKAAECTKAQVFFFGLQEDSDYYATDIQMSSVGTEFTCVEKITGRNIHVKLPVLGRHNVYNALAVIVVCRCYGMTMEEIVDALRDVKLTGSRLEIIDRNGIIFIDDSYNASPASMVGALETLSLVKEGAVQESYARSIAILSDMLELGSITDDVHQQVGRVCSEQKIDYVFTYGDNAKNIYIEAKKRGVKVQMCRDVDHAAKCLDHVVRQGDVVLLKGSHSMQVGRVLEYFAE